MERSREARRSSTMLASNGNGLSRRRHKSIGCQDRHEEGNAEFRQMVRLRERTGKRERDREVMGRSKRRRGISNGEECDGEEGNESAEDSIGDEGDFEVEDGGVVSRTVSPATASNQSHRRNSLSQRVAKQPSRVADDVMIGVPVPRKARTASAKRSVENNVYGHCGSGTGGRAGEEQNQRRPSDSPARSSAETVSPSSSNVEHEKKMKLTGAQTQASKVAPCSPSSSQQEDIEIEIAEVLFGLKKQSRVSKTKQKSETSSPKHESENTAGATIDMKSSTGFPTSDSAQAASQISISPQNENPASDILPGICAPEKTNLGAEASLALDTSDSVVLAAARRSEIGASKGEYRSSESRITLPKQEVALTPMERSTSGDGAVADDKSILTKEEQPSYALPSGDPQDSKGTKPVSSIPDAENGKGKQFEIDLMAPPPMALSPESDALIDLREEVMVKGEENVERVMEKVPMLKQVEEKIEKTGEKCESLNLYVKIQASERCTVSELQGQKQKSQASDSKIEKTDQSLVSLPVASGSWIGNPSPFSCAPFHTVVPIEGIKGSSTALEPLLSFPQSRPNRCSTHQYIARNIYLHQQFLKTSHLLPAASSPTSVTGAKSGNPKIMCPAGNLTLGLNLNSTEDGCQDATDFPGHDEKGKSPGASNFVDTAQIKRDVLKQSQPASSANSTTGTDVIISPSQHQQVMAIAQTGTSKSANLCNNTSLSNASSAAHLGSAPALPTLATTISFSHPTLHSNVAPCVAVLQNYVYPFPIPASVGATAAYGANAAQVMPFYSGSFHPSQLAHPSQLKQQQPSLQPTPHHMVLQIQQPGGSSSSGKQQSLQPFGVQVTGNTSLALNGEQLQQSLNLQMPLSAQSRKFEHTSGDATACVASGLSHHTQKKVEQNFSFAIPAVSFNLIPSTTLNSGGNHGDKKQQQRQQQLDLQGPKGSNELVQSQPFAMSFTPFNASGAPSGFNFSSMPQSLQDVSRGGLQMAPSLPATVLKNHNTSEGRNGGFSCKPDNDKKGDSGKPSTTSGQTLYFGNSARTLNFMSSPVPAGWPHIIASAAATTDTPIAGTSSISQQQQHHLHPPKQLILQWPQPDMATRTKSPISNSLPSSSLVTKFPKTTPAFSQSLIQCSSSSESPQTTGRVGLSIVPTSPHKSFPQQHGRATQGETQISFGGNSTSDLVVTQEQRSLKGLRSTTTFVTGSPVSCGSLKASSTGSKTGASISTLQSQQGDSSSTGTGQKSSPACGRNVPPILSTCCSHLSELKY